MIAQLFPETYDTQGRLTFRPDLKKHRRFSSTFPMGRYISIPIKIECKNFEELRRFFLTCKPVSDLEQFGEEEFWMPPDEFERARKGDCEDFALYAWRQLMNMGYKTRFVIGTVGYEKSGHAWVTFQKDDQTFLFEPLECFFGMRIPRLSTLRHRPAFSVEWVDEKLRFYQHQTRENGVQPLQIPGMVLEWLYLRPLQIIKILWRIAFHRLRRMQKRFLKVLE
jgi:hypothetical protein